MLSYLCSSFIWQIPNHSMNQKRSVQSARVGIPRLSNWPVDAAYTLYMLFGDSANPCRVTQAQLLKEIIAASTLPSQTLAAIIHDLQIPPSWEDIRVPPGMIPGPSTEVDSSLLFLEWALPFNVVFSKFNEQRHESTYVFATLT